MKFSNWYRMQYVIRDKKSGLYLSKFNLKFAVTNGYSVSTGDISFAPLDSALNFQTKIEADAVAAFVNTFQQREGADLLETINDNSKFRT